MGLILPNGPAFAHWSDNLGTVSADGFADVGVAITPGTSNADGDAVTLLSSLAHDCEYLVLAISGFGLSGSNSSALLDILVDPAGGTSWSELIADLLCGYTSPIDYDGSGILAVPLMYHFPVWIPAGASVGAMARCAHGSAFANAPRVVAYAAGGNKNPASWWCGQRIETVGTFDADNSRGQVHTPGEDGTFSSWTSLGSPIASRAGALQYAVQGPGSSSVSGRVYRFEFGAGSSQIGPCCYRGMGAVEVGTHFFPGPVFCDIPAGTQMQVRAAENNVSLSAQSLDCAAYLVQ